MDAAAPLATAGRSEPTASSIRIAFEEVSGGSITVGGPDDGIDVGESEKHDLDRANAITELIGKDDDLSLAFDKAWRQLYPEHGRGTCYNHVEKNTGPMLVMLIRQLRR